MNHEEFSWQTSDHVQLYAQQWAPDRDPVAVVCLVHGLGEHSGRYRHVAGHFNEAGWAVITFDLRGHGKSGGQRGHTPSFNSYMTDIDLLMQEASRRYPGKPQVIYGHSLGGLLVLNYVERRKPGVAAAVATSPGLVTSLQDQKLMVFMARFLGKLIPTGTISSGLDANGLSHDRAVIDEYKRDPLVHDKTTFRLGRELLNSVDYAFAHAHEFPVPLLLIHGEKDPIAFASGSEKFAALAPDVTTLTICPDLYHELHNELCKEDILRDIVQWISSKLPSDPPGQT